ncbi:hypothetical protein TWF730_010876 [Orbilia blumenaviensis]|uniref:Uncharacterized protein n=1 Tax=Orbilia blumenaviensis TaxID=1796055 RepID=A0AAV9UJT6_9PEZI
MHITAHTLFSTIKTSSSGNITKLTPKTIRTLRILTKSSTPINHNHNHNQQQQQQQQQHYDIPSFLRYASLTSLNPTTTVFNGTLYEYTVLAALARCLPGISLTRVGGRDDAGVDLLGRWELPRIPRRITTLSSSSPSSSSSPNNDNYENNITQDEPQETEQQQEQKGRKEKEQEEEEEKEDDTTLPLTIQCKNVQQKSWKGPQYIRELEGALVSRPVHALGILASVRDITPGMKKQMLASRRALGFVKVTPLESIFDNYDNNNNNKKEKEVEGKTMEEFRLTGRGGLLQQFAWNEVANRYIGGFGIGARYVERSCAIKGIELGGYLLEEGEREEEDSKTQEPEQEIALTWHGIPVSNL